MTRFGYVMVTYFSIMGVVIASFIPTPTRLMWNVSASAPIGLYDIDPPGDLTVTALVAVDPPKPLADFMVERGYIGRGVPLLKRVMALPEREGFEPSVRLPPQRFSRLSEIPPASSAVCNSTFVRYLGTVLNQTGHVHDSEATRKLIAGSRLKQEFGETTSFLGEVGQDQIVVANSVANAEFLNPFS